MTNTIFVHSSVRRIATSLTNQLTQWFKAAFASRCAHVWLWYTSHADGYTPYREQAKRELGLSDYVLTKCLRALERVGLAALDITRARGKVSCWRVFKRPVYTPQPCSNIPPAPPMESYPETDEQAQNSQATQSVLPPNFLPPKKCTPLGNKKGLKEKSINPTPNPKEEPNPVYTELQEQGGRDIEYFVQAYPKDLEGSDTHRKFAKQHLQRIQKTMPPSDFVQFLSDLRKDVSFRLKNCHFWRSESYRPNVARYVADELWKSAICPKTDSKAVFGARTSTRALTLADELNDCSWAY